MSATIAQNLDLYGLMWRPSKPAPQPPKENSTSSATS